MKPLLFYIGLTAVLTGCSPDSTSSNPTTYPLQLAELSTSEKPQGSTIGTYHLQVSKNGSLLKGALLTVVGYPADHIDTVKFKGAPLLSDSAGAFNFAYDWGNSASIAFRAKKDSLVSNYLKY